jgi:hypothetical protein
MVQLRPKGDPMAPKVKPKAKKMSPKADEENQGWGGDPDGQLESTLNGGAIDG